jgi:hypothetical protein
MEAADPWVAHRFLRGATSRSTGDGGCRSHHARTGLVQAVREPMRAGRSRARTRCSAGQRRARPSRRCLARGATTPVAAVPDRSVLSILTRTRHDDRRRSSLVALDGALSDGGVVGLVLARLGTSQGIASQLRRCPAPSGPDRCDGRVGRLAGLPSAPSMPSRHGGRVGSVPRVVGRDVRRIAG